MKNLEKIRIFMTVFVDKSTTISNVSAVLIKVNVSRIFLT